MKVLISAYACKPNCGSEDENGWNWAWYLAKSGYEVWVLTFDDNKEVIKQELALQSISNIHFVYIAIPQSIKLFIRNPIGDFGWQSRYLGWQKQAYKIAQQLDREQKFDLVHHVTWASITAGSWLWRLNKPFIFGPVGGGQITPSPFKKYFPYLQWQKEVIRSFLVKSSKFNLISRQTVSNANLVLVTNQDTYNLARQLGANRIEFFPVIGLAENYLPPELPFRQPSPELRLLWVGSPRPMKACPLALEALAKVNSLVPFKLTVVGYSQSNRELISLIDKLGLKDRVDCIGRVSWAELKKEYFKNDVFLFTSLRNSLGAQLFEAMACGLPIISLNHQGAKDFVPDHAGIKVSVTNPPETSKAIAEAIEYMYHNPERRGEMSETSYQFAKTQTWSNRTLKISQYYEQLNNSSSKVSPDIENVRIG